MSQSIRSIRNITYHSRLSPFFISRLKIKLMFPVYSFLYLKARVDWPWSLPSR